MHEHEHGEQRAEASTQATEWDARYSERDGARWSGRPNGRLVSEVADLSRGRALDVGCGEGALQYPALPKAAGDAAVRTLLDAVRPGGLLLPVYHDLDDERREHMKSRGIDPADYVSVDDLRRLLGTDFTVERHAVEPRIDPPPGTEHIADVVLRARRARITG